MDKLSGQRKDNLLANYMASNLNQLNTSKNSVKVKQFAVCGIRCAAVMRCRLKRDHIYYGHVGLGSVKCLNICLTF